MSYVFCTECDTNSVCSVEDIDVQFHLVEPAIIKFCVNAEQSCITSSYTESIFLFCCLAQQLLA